MASGRAGDEGFPVERPPAGERLEYTETRWDAASRTEMHHTVPTQILDDYLSPEVANHPLVRGTRGSPNRWPIPRELHREIHRGPRGGAYNARWRQEINAIRATGREVGVFDVLRLRIQLTTEFGLEVYRP